MNYFKGFDMVMNALDNRAARNHVNRMCLAADVPLIESGTAGYLGQVTLIKKGNLPPSLMRVIALSLCSTVSLFFLITIPSQEPRNVTSASRSLVRRRFRAARSGTRRPNRFTASSGPNISSTSCSERKIRIRTSLLTRRIRNWLARQVRNVLVELNCN